MVDTSTEAVTKLLDEVTPGYWFSDGYRVEDFIPAARDLVPAMLAERDALRRENESLRQIERNVQAVREHEYKRAEAALAEVERLMAQPAQAVKVKRLRYFDPQGDTIDQMRDHARQHPLAKQGDMKLVWVNEGDLYNHVLSAIQSVQSITVQDAVKVPEIAALIERVEHLFDVYDEAGRQLGKSERKLKDALRPITEGRE